MISFWHYLSARLGMVSNLLKSLWTVHHASTTVYYASGNDLVCLRDYKKIAYHASETKPEKEKLLWIGRYKKDKQNKSTGFIE